MVFSNIISKYKKFVFGDESNFDVQKRVFLLITHISIVIGFIGIIVNIVLGLGVFLTVFTLLAVILVIYFHIKVRISSLKLKYPVSFFVLSLIVFPVLWFYNGGYNGNNTILIFVYFIVMTTILPSKLRLVSFLAYALLITALTITHYYFPQLVTPYSNEYQRFIDMIIGSLLYLVLAFSIQNMIIKNYDYERGRVNQQNDKLNNLVEELNIAKTKLEVSLKSIKELNYAKDRFITVLSHDLRSPFQGIMGITKTIESDYNSFTDNEKKYFISQVNRSLDKLYGFLEELLLWGRINNNALVLTKETHNVNELLRQISELHTDLASKKKISINIDCEDSVRFNFDKEMISIVIRNLLTNAIKFSPFGNKIDISAEVKNGNLFIAVKDNGIGISQENKSKLFKLDEIISTAGTDGEQGTGMGLILCHDIMLQHNGTIAVSSKEGKGATFTIQITD